ncbi:hypothetical protein ACS0TY_010793 [Phlomoides rotata]
MVGVEPCGSSGGLALFWTNEIHCDLRSYSIGHIDILVSGLQFSWRFTGIYGNPNTHLRKHTWDLLRKLKSIPMEDNEKWLVGGDFNEIVLQSEKKRGTIRNRGPMNAFRDVLDFCDLLDVGAKGPSSHCTIKGRAEIRAVVMQLDSAPVPRLGRKKQGFIFENKWALEDTFESTIKTVWQESGQGENLPKRLTKCGQKISQWAKQNVGNVQQRIKALESKLDFILENDTEGEGGEVLKNTESEIERLRMQEEAHWHQRSCSNWILCGDRNTHAFHRLASGRKKRNAIKGLENTQE